MIGRPPRSTLTDTPLPYPPLFRAPDAPRLQSARDPEAVAARLVGQHHAIDRPARSASFRLPPLQRAQQNRHVPRIEPPPGTPRNTRHDRADLPRLAAQFHRSEEHTSELQSLMRISYAVFCLK